LNDQVNYENYESPHDTFLNLDASHAQCNY